MPRLFTALEIPRDAALSLSLLRGGLPGARWIDVENYHLTLRFIGDIEGHLADEIVDALDRVHRPSFSLSLTGVGAFGGKKPHAVWAGAAASPDLAALQGEIERICQRVGVAADPRKFMPHVTLARLRDASPLDRQPETGPARVDDLIDEIHAWRKRALWDVIRTGLVKVPGSLSVVITTAGRGQDNIAHEVIDYARRVARGEIEIRDDRIAITVTRPADVYDFMAGAA